MTSRARPTAERQRAARTEGRKPYDVRGRCAHAPSAKLSTAQLTTLLRDGRDCGGRSLFRHEPREVLRRLCLCSRQEAVREKRSRLRHFQYGEHVSGTCARELNYGGDVQIICVCLSERPGSVTKRRQNAKKCGGALQSSYNFHGCYSRRFGVPKFRLATRAPERGAERGEK